MLGALVVALMVISAACTRPNSVQNQILPTPTPSPTPTTPLVLTASAPFHVGEVGVAYAPVALTATGGVQPYTWSVNAGALPGGLTIANDGNVSGTPTASGNFTFTIQVADSGNSTANLPGSIAIAAALSASLIPACASQCSVELGCVSVCGAFGQLSGGISPYSYALTSGQLPAGTSLSGLSLTGTFVGSSGYLRFSVQVTDGIGVTATVSPLFWMYDHISLASGGTCYGDYSTGCTARIPISGGNGGYAIRLVNVAPNTTPNPPPYQGQCWQLALTAPPPASSATVSGNVVIVYIPKNNINGYGAIWTLRLSDQFLCSADTYCTAPDVTVRIGVQCG